MTTTLSYSGDIQFPFQNENANEEEQQVRKFVLSFAIVSMALLLFAAPAFAAETDDTDPSVHYSDGWAQASAGSLTDARNGTLMQTNAAGASAETTFKGTWVEFYSRIGNQAGMADIYIDGNKAATVDLYGSPRASGVKVFEKRDLSRGEHTFKIVNTGSKNEASGGTYIFFDALVYEGTDSPGQGGGNQDGAGVYRNPLVKNIADPRIMRASTDGQYYLYPSGWKVYSSPDLVHWQDRGPALRREDIAWGGDIEPADPGALEHNGKFYLFYSFKVPNVRYYSSTAVSDSPLGPFVDDAEHPSYDFGYSTLDPMVFKDDDGKPYLYYSWNLGPVGNHRESRIYGVELADDLRTPIGEPKLLLKPNQPWEGGCDPNCPDGAQRWNEAPYMVKHNGTYYLTYSANCYCNKNYAVGYATSQSPLGPFVKYENNPILSSDYSAVSGSGRSSLIQSPDNTEWFMAYHTHIDPTKGGAPRQLNIDRMGFRKDGTMYVNGPTLTEQPMPSGTDGWTNMAGQAKITVSSTKPGFSPEALNDGEFGVYAKNSMYDWVADGETTGAWVKLQWDKNTAVDSIWLYDSADPQRALKKGKVTVSHGNKTTEVEFPGEPGAAAVVHLDGKKIKWLKFEVTETASGGAAETGLSEIIVIGK